MNNPARKIAGREELITNREDKMSTPTETWTIFLEFSLLQWYWFLRYSAKPTHPRIAARYRIKVYISFSKSWLTGNGIEYPYMFGYFSIHFQCLQRETGLKRISGRMSGK